MNALGSYVESWSPEPVTDSDALPSGPAAALSAALDLPRPAAAAGQALPPLWHWLYFLEWPRHSEIGVDGHPADGHFLPPLPDRRRMFAGGRLQVRAPLVLGTPAERTRSLGEVAVKHGRTGEMLFVTVRSEISQDGTVRVVEEQDIVYRSGEDAGRTALAALDVSGKPESAAEWQQAWTPDPVLLFRFSALTANAHRIHYDEPYVTGTEGYPGLVVHGPLLVLLLLELARTRAPERATPSLSYRLRRPVFAGEHLLATGVPADGGAALQVDSARTEAVATADVVFA
ncbi:hypothetical protein QRX50_33285 [Amycolatopsis carbonis]|uniref:N-terminal of MaoC-like dehydratase domain-containing protein n=1 Tax=Amycolatopsis carbonis TaxID=715471 RepID=A0A9Y2IDD9_9PSEU|nr:hypothetical protein [Amycolatopsis sp. 2-15]WIX76318.1 hypothetical protein QRX50_33285 [Amycolatopsis sp. 2-15]